MTYKFYFHVCKELIKSDLLVFKQLFVGKLINIIIWVALTLVVMGYVMQYFGLQQNFGVFQLGGVIASTGLFEMYSSTIDLLSDYEHDKLMQYHFTLPIKSGLALISKCIYFALIYFTLSIIMLPIGKVMLWPQLNMMEVAYIKFILALCAGSFFYATFALWASSFIRNMSEMGDVWSRFIFPLWFMRGFQFSWFSLYETIPMLAYINLLNPMIYITEAIRASIIGQQNYIDFWLCIGAIILFTGIFLIHAMYRLKRRLDFV